MTTTQAMTTDRIEREIVLAAPRARVFAALSEPAELARWFTRAEVEMRPGATGTFNFEHDVAPVQIVAVEPPSRFAFRWRPYDADLAVPIEALPSTLVEFTLDEVAEGTRLRLVESGFAGLPEEIRAKQLADNNGGWDECLNNLTAALTAPAAASEA